jgi:hypothetical protein
MATIYRHSILGNMETIRRRGYECLCLCDESVYIRLLHLEKAFLQDCLVALQSTSIYMGWKGFGWQVNWSEAKQAFSVEQATHPTKASWGRILWYSYHCSYL